MTLWHNLDTHSVSRLRSVSSDATGTDVIRFRDRSKRFKRRNAWRLTSLRLDRRLPRSDLQRCDIRRWRHRMTWNRRFSTWTGDGMSLATRKNHVSFKNRTISWMEERNWIWLILKICDVTEPNITWVNRAKNSFSKYLRSICLWCGWFEAVRRS